MRARSLLAGLSLLLIVAVVPATAQQQPDPDSPRYQGVVALQGFLASDGDEALDQFIADRIAIDYVESLEADDLRSMLAELREQFSGLEMRGARPVGPLSATMMYPEDRQVTFELSPHDPTRIVSIEAGES